MVINVPILSNISIKTFILKVYFIKTSNRMLYILINIIISGTSVTNAL